MGPLDLFYHLLSFVAPALAVGLLVALAAPLVVRRAPVNGALWRHFALNSIAGVLVLGAGLWHYGVDGKMATYTALVVVVATCQWLSSRAFSR